MSSTTSFGVICAGCVSSRSARTPGTPTGLNAQEYNESHEPQPLHVPGRTQRPAEVGQALRRRIQTDERIQHAMAKGRALARSGVLQDKAAEAHAQPQPRLARALDRQRTASVLGARRAQNFRAAREVRAEALGYVSLEAYLWARYYNEDGRIEDLTADLRASWSTVRGDLDRLGIPVRPRGRRRRS